jgi:hypothetical protein
MIRRLLDRHAVRAFLANREALPFADWHRQLWHQRNISEAASAFVYEHFGKYSGLDFARVRPEDRLAEELRFSTTTYGDWDLDLYEEFQQVFGIDLRRTPAPKDLSTVEDWLRYLDRCLATLPRRSK